MPDITVSILSASGARGGPVLFNSSDRLSLGDVYEALQNFQGEMGYLVTVSGAGVERGCMGLMKPGKYTFITTGKRAKGPMLCMEEFLRAPLPEPTWTGTLELISDRSPNQSTHPTMVTEWPGWQAELRQRLERIRPWWKSARYKRTGTALSSNVTGPAAALQATACQRINTLFDINRNECDSHFCVHPSKRTSEDAAREGQGPEVQTEAEEALQNDAPDICLVRQTDFLQQICQTTLCKSWASSSMCHMSMPAIWNAVRNGEPVADTHAAHCVVDAIAQELGFMSRRGHKTGSISSYFNTWLLKTDGRGCVWISDPVPYDSVGTHISASVTEVLLYSALCNLYGYDSKPYPAARSPGEAPISMQDFSADRKKAQAAMVPKRRRLEVSSSESSGSGCTELRSGRTYPTPGLLSFDMLHLSTRLASSVFLGSVYGTVAAIRLANRPVAMRDAASEARVYERLQRLQGECVPRLIAHGPLSDTKAYFVATEFMEGVPWDWHAPSHRALDHKLKSALVQIHDAGVLHRDLHEGNILVTPDHRVLVLDFAAAQLDPRRELMDAELESLGLTS